MPHQINNNTMKKTKCYSVRLQSLISISDKCYKATAFDGSTALIPKSQVFGQDYDVLKSDAYWISCWILEKNDLQFSTKKVGWYNPSTDIIENNISKTITVNVPSEIKNVEVSYDSELFK